MASLLRLLCQRDSESHLVIGQTSIVSTVGFHDLPESGSGKAVALRISDCTELIRTLVSLEGRVEKMLLLSAALPADQAEHLVLSEGIQALVTDCSEISQGIEKILPHDAPERLRGSPRKTEWLLTTSGTTGVPKRVSHTLQTLTRTVVTGTPKVEPRWGLLYDPTRFAGLQVVLQALVGGGTLIAPDIETSMTDQIAFLAEHGCTHLSATPSLWRRILMAPAHEELNLSQITLGGEIVDQPILDRLRGAFPSSRITHIYASTEAGVGFSVTDEREGFPVDYLYENSAGIDMLIKNGVLWLKPENRAKEGQCTQHPEVELDTEGYICSGDKIELKGNRAVFLGRENGVINVGGAKVYPEAVERVLLQLPDIELVQISAKQNPISGSLVTAKIVVRAGADHVELKQAALNLCRASLPREAVPAILTVVKDFNTNSAGKLVRR